MTENKGFKLTYSGELTSKYISALLISIAKQLIVENANELPQILLNNSIYRQFLNKQIYIKNLIDWKGDLLGFLYRFVYLGTVYKLNYLIKFVEVH